MSWRSDHVHNGSLVFSGAAVLLLMVAACGGAESQTNGHPSAVRIPKVATASTSGDANSVECSVVVKPDGTTTQSGKASVSAGSDSISASCPGGGSVRVTNNGDIEIKDPDCSVKTSTSGATSMGGDGTLVEKEPKGGIRAACSEANAEVVSNGDLKVNVTGHPGGSPKSSAPQPASSTGACSVKIGPDGTVSKSGEGATGLSPDANGRIMASCPNGGSVDVDATGASMVVTGLGCSMDAEGYDLSVHGHGPGGSYKSESKGRFTVSCPGATVVEGADHRVTVTVTGP